VRQGEALSVVMWSTRPWEAPAPSTVTSRSRRYRAGIWVMASLSTVM
jgi:hypothetical protein